MLVAPLFYYAHYKVLHLSILLQGLKATAAEPSQLVWDQKPKPAARFKSPMGGDGIFGSMIRNRVYENQRVFQVR